VLAIPFQGETVGPRRWAAVAAGFAGAIIILRPGAAPMDLAMLSAVGSSLLFALALIQSRTLVAEDGAVSVFLSSVVVTLVVAVPAALPVWSLPQAGWGWLLACAVVAAGAVRGLADIQAYHHAEASVLAPITYLRLVILGAAGYLLYGEVVDNPTIAGAAVITGSTLYIARREAQLRRIRRASIDP
jgi:drug/metabolite transporter (DMT)-like permease